MNNEVNSTPIREQVFKKLRWMILKYDLKPGDKVIEANIAEQFNVSRTPVREALHRLEEEGLIEILPRRYCLVKGITIDSIHEINLIRAKLEPEAAIIATQNLSEEDLKNLESVLLSAAEAFENNDVETLISLNDEFHNIIIDAANLPRISKLLDNLQDYFMLFRYSYMEKRELARRTIVEHEEILYALKMRNKVLVEKVYKKHVYGILDYEYMAINDNEKHIHLIEKGDKNDKEKL